MRSVFYSIILSILVAQSCKSNGNDPVDSMTKVSISASEEGAAIYLNGVYTGEQTPAVLNVSSGVHTIGVGLNRSRQYLKKTVSIENTVESYEIVLSEADLQQAKKWKALFVGVNKVSKSTEDCITQYTTEELDLAFDFLNWSFQEKLEPFSYHTMDWEFERRDISDQTVILDEDNLINPTIFENHITDIDKGDYDLVITFFRGEQEDCFIANFIGIAWFDVTELSSESSYYTIRYYDDIKASIEDARKNDPGVFVHEWLHTVAERFYPNRGEVVPDDDGLVVHAAGKFGYTFPWMTWYEDLISGQVVTPDGYAGIGPEALLQCTVRESALRQCP
ncbi:MAG: PEGA domain-containing protein [Reichenbachiella sp.]|uniref:PEGA domain-containing protein n=1 Tax=Reichenbachiella sp. TaxID=2184521 RepID=UPI0032664559